MNNNLTITIVGAQGATTRAMLEARLGPCSGSYMGAAVTVTTSEANGRRTLAFDMPRDLSAAIPEGSSINIGPGVLVARGGTIDGATMKAEGGGSATWQALRSTPGFKSRAPDLPKAWLDAIRAAVAKGA